MGKNVRLTEVEKSALLAKGIKPPKTRKVRRKELDGLFLVYSALISPDEFFLQVLNKETLYKNYNVGLLKKFEVATKYLKLKFEDSMDDRFRQDVRMVSNRIKDFEDFLSELAGKKKSIDLRIKDLKSYVARADYKKKTVETVADLLGDCFKLMGIPVSSRQKRNAGLSLPYIQFSLSSKLDSAMDKASKSEIETYTRRKRTLQAQEKQLHEELRAEGYVVRKTRDFFSSEGTSGMVFATVAYNAGIEKLGKPPKKPYRNRAMSDAEYALAIEEYKERLAEYRQDAEKEVAAVFSPYLKSEDGAEFKRFSNMTEFREAMVSQKKKEVILSQQFPTIETIKIPAGTKTVRKKIRGTDDYEEIEEPIFDYLSEVRFGDGENGHPLKNYSERLDEAYGEVETAQLSDGEGDSKSALTRVVKTRKILVGEQELDVIVEGRFKGFLFEEMVNSMGRLIEGTYHSHNANGEKVEIELIDNVFVDKTARTSRGKALGDVNIRPTSEKEVSFLDLENEATAAGYKKVLNNRLREPYITLSQDKTRLILGIPSTEAHTVDRNLIKKLAKVMPGLEQKKDPRLSNITNGRNPFYYFDAPTYEAIRNSLGSVALSKKAMSFLDRYYKDLLARDRALEDENVKRFNASEVGGFVETFKGKPFNFNNKQREGMAWMEANNYSGMMALDTGVGKTLLAGGAMMHFINHKEGGGGTKKFLFVSPKRLQGNFSREMSTFLKDKGVIESRVEEMNYLKFARMVRAIDTLPAIMKKPKEKRDKDLARIPLDFWSDVNKLKPAYKDSTSYFKAVYQMCFFDEVNEALSGSKRKAITDLKHPHKILLSASPMEKDPLDLYRFVAIAKGDNYTREKERAFAERFGNVIGGRFVGLKNDPEVRLEFNTWVKANAYFADKQEVDLSEINMPELLRPTEEIVSVKMDPAVAKEYKKVAKQVQRELKAMVKKYRDVLLLGEDARPSSFQTGNKAIKDFATGGMKKLKDLLTLSTDPASYKVGGATPFKDIPNPKLQEAEKVLKDRAGKRVCYFSFKESFVSENARAMSASGVGGVHAALRANAIEFYRAGKKIGRVNKKTGKSEASKLDRLMRTASSIQLDYSFIKDPVYADKVRDFKELAERNLETYKDNLELEELATIQTSFTIFVKAIQDRNLDKVKSSFKSLDKTYFKTFDFIAEQWAIDVVKGIIRDNPNIKTLTCSDKYAKGFNFQFIDTVVHLDRGANFDSENVKQRTARAYRTGQDKQVEVLFLDSLVDGGKHSLSDIESDDKGNVVKAPKKDDENISLDELQALVQKVDQKFFTDIIRQGQETNLIDTYESVKRTTGKLVSTNKNLLAQILNPTAENIAKMAERLSDEENNPIKVAQLNPERFATNPSLMDALRESAAMSGQSVGALKDILDISGATALGSHHFGSNPAIVVDGEAVISEGKFAKMSVSIESDDNGERVLHNDYIQASSCAPKGTVSKIVFGQVAKALADGVSSKITTDVSSSDITPLRLGFSAKVVLPFLQVADEMLTPDESYIKDWLNRHDLITEKGAVEICSLFACTNRNKLIGQDWWRDNASSVALPSKATLNLGDKSISMRLINAYFKLKSAQTGLSIAEFFSTVEMPFDIDDPACWLKQLGSESPADMVKHINSYRKEFKVAYYALPEIQEKTPESIVTKFKLRKGRYSAIVDDQEYSAEIDPNKQAKDPLLDEAWLSISDKIEKVTILTEDAFEEGDALKAEEIKGEELDEALTTDEVVDETDVDSQEPQDQEESQA
jgi:hypothetical protein